MEEEESTQVNGEGGEEREASRRSLFGLVWHRLRVYFEKITPVSQTFRSNDRL